MSSSGWVLGAGLDQALTLAARPAVLDLRHLLRHAPAHPLQRAGLVVVIDEPALPRVLGVEAADEFVALRHLALEDPAHVALVADDVGREEQEQVGLLLLGALAAEQPA